MRARTVAVCGSCATRDNFNAGFNPDHRRWYDTALSNHQSSVLALMSPPIAPEPDQTDGLDEQGERTVRADLSRSFLAGLADLKPDYLILDFSGDVWLGALQLPDGRYLTDNIWNIRTTGYYRRLVAAGGTTALNWRTDADGYLERWIESMDRFAAFIAEHCPDTHVIVHRLRSVNEVTLGSADRPRNLRRWARLQPLAIRRINQFRNRLDEHAITAYGWDSIDLRAERYSAYAHHPWGPFWVHYTLDYHRRFLAELHQRDLATRVDDEVAEKVRTIAAAGRERLIGQARFVRRADAVQRDVITRLEARGPLRAGASAARRRMPRKVAT